MTDSEYLKWVAEHLVMFHPSFSSAYMEYVDDAGFEHSLTYTTPITLGDDTTALLKGCIDEVAK